MKEPKGKTKTTGTLIKVPKGGEISDEDIDKALDAIFGPDDESEEEDKTEGKEE